MTTRRARVAGLALGVAVLGACGGGASDVAAPATEPVTTAPAARAVATTVAEPLPSVQLRDVRGGGTVDLASFLPAKQPILLWFYAPH